MALFYPYISRVYPRVCGGAKPAEPITVGEWGLSPRVRGSLPHR